jgi:hypothetical protein
MCESHSCKNDLCTPSFVVPTSYKGFKDSVNHLECVHTLQTKVPEANCGLLVAVHQLWLPDT